MGTKKKQPCYITKKKVTIVMFAILGNYYCSLQATWKGKYQSTNKKTQNKGKESEKSYRKLNRSL